jgi:hypothetical protein
MDSNFKLTARILVLTLFLLATTNSPAGQRRCCQINPRPPAPACPWDPSSFSFVGTPLDQAKCLLRHVKVRGNLDGSIDRLPGPLEDIIGKPVTINVDRLRSYLSTHQLTESDVGGDLSKPLSPIDSTHPNEERARYFVIHDTSTPNYWNAIPANINEAAWSGNNLSRVDRTIAHVYVNRLGQSATVVNFENVLPRTKFGTKFACCLGERQKGLFIHIEMIQPRHCDSTNGRCAAYKSGSDIASHASNDNLAPSPGFTKAQMDRLALLYVAASVRKHKWLIPSFHAPMDATLRNAHDDPQNFDLADWANSLGLLLTELGAPGG